MGTRFRWARFVCSVKEFPDQLNCSWSSWSWPHRAAYCLQNICHRMSYLWRTHMLKVPTAQFSALVAWNSWICLLGNECFKLELSKLRLKYVLLIPVCSKPLSYWCPKLTVDKSVVSEFYHIDLFVRKWFIEPPFASFQYRGYGFFFLEVSAIHI